MMIQQLLLFVVASMQPRSLELHVRPWVPQTRDSAAAAAAASVDVEKVLLLFRTRLDT